MSDQPKGDGRKMTRIFLRHHKTPEFEPRTTTCQDYTDAGGRQFKGCGASVIRYTSYKNHAGMRFDGRPEIVPGTEGDDGNGGIAAWVYMDTFHQVTCPYARRPRVNDGKAAAAGAESR